MSRAVRRPTRLDDGSCGAALSTARILLETALRHDGADVMTASSVAEAFDAIGRRSPDVILSDIGMPHEDGYAFVRRLRACPAPQGDIPAVAVTAYASDGDRAASEAAGYQAHVAKPFEPGELARMVSRVATRHNVQVINDT